MLSPTPHSAERRRLQALASLLAGRATVGLGCGGGGNELDDNRPLRELCIFRGGRRYPDSGPIMVIRKPNFSKRPHPPNTRVGNRICSSGGNHTRYGNSVYSPRGYRRLVSAMDR